MAAVRLAHTSELEVATLAAVQRMVGGAFPGNFDDHDWEHALGGIHAIVEEDLASAGP